MLGSDIAYIDLHSGKNIINDGFSFRKDIRSGISESTAGDLSSFTGRVVADNSTLAINNKFWESLRQRIRVRFRLKAEMWSLILVPQFQMTVL